LLLHFRAYSILPVPSFGLYPAKLCILSARKLFNSLQRLRWLFIQLLSFNLQWLPCPSLL
jgi:hypothetical protein